MSTPFGNPAVRYGLALGNAAILAFVALTFLGGIARWAVLLVAAVEVLVVPQVLKRVDQGGTETA